MFFSSSNSPLQSVLVLDIDGTLYDDDTEIEYQIAKQCDKFASKFGSSEIEGNYSISKTLLLLFTNLYYIYSLFRHAQQ